MVKTRHGRGTQHLQADQMHELIIGVSEGFSSPLPRLPFSDQVLQAWPQNHCYLNVGRIGLLRIGPAQSCLECKHLVKRVEQK